MGDDGASGCTCKMLDSAGSTALDEGGAGGAAGGIINGPGREYDVRCICRTVRQWSGSSFAEMQCSKAQSDLYRKKHTELLHL
jgi:hypothetical protein